MDRSGQMWASWAALDAAIFATGSLREILDVWPWDSSVPEVRAAWDALTRPELLPDLEALIVSDTAGGANEWAAEVTRKATEISRARAAQRAEPGAAADGPRL